jgi:hypothetical protein
MRQSDRDDADVVGGRDRSIAAAPAGSCTLVFARAADAATLRAVIPVTKWFYLVVLALWVGSIMFFSFVVAPTVFKVLKPEEAARLQRALFPRYYLVGVICAGVGIVCVGLLLAERAFGRWPGVLSLLLLAAMGATNFWLRQTVVPRMAELREQRVMAAAEDSPDAAEAEAEWKSLHRMSVKLNVAVLICGWALLYLLVFAKVV